MGAEGERALAYSFVSREAAKQRLVGIKNTRRHERTNTDAKDFHLTRHSYDDDALSIDCVGVRSRSDRFENALLTPTALTL